MRAEEQAEIRRRQRARATVVAWLLGGFVVLVFAIAIVKISEGARAGGTGAAAMVRP